MLRGSRPGERRGGRERLTPNRRTILTDRILAVGLDHPTASRRKFLGTLVKDQKLPADTRIAVAPKCFPGKGAQSCQTERPRILADIAKADSSENTAGLSLQALDSLFGIVQDVTAAPRARRKAALKIAEFLLPKGVKKPKLLPDEYGFLVHAKLASLYRDMRLEVRSLLSKPTRVVPAIAEKIKKLEMRSDAILQNLQVPCPTKYGDKAAATDYFRLIEFAKARDNGIALTEAQDAEEAHVKVRLDVFAISPEQVARKRRKALDDAERSFKRNRWTRSFYAPPLSRKEQNDLKLLRRLYPEPTPTRILEGRELEILGAHPFRDELPAADGNFYPPGSKLRLASAADNPAVDPVLDQQQRHMVDHR